jgi:ketosteroid isomerase-like protein
MNRLFVLLPLLLIAAGCQQAPMNTDTSAISERSAAWQQAMNDGDIDALTEIYSGDAQLMPPNEPMSESRDAIRERFSDMMQNGIKVYLSNVEVKASGKLGYHVGTYVVKSADDQQLGNGKFVEIWQQDGNGQWHITSDIWNSDNPEQMAASEGTRIMLTHEVKDGAHWLDAWRGEDGRRKLFAENGLTDVHTFQSVDDPNLMGLEFTGDMADFQSMMDDPDSQAAAQEDGVELDSLKLFKEAE